MDADPDNRQTAEEILKIIVFWNDAINIDEILESKSNNYSKEQLDELKRMRIFFYEMDNIKYHPSTVTATIHPGAVYTSRLLRFTDLPQPLNSNKVTIINDNNGNYLIFIVIIIY